MTEDMLKGAPTGTLGLAAGPNKKAWMCTDLFLLVLEHFIKHTGSSKENPALLIADNHSSHISIPVLSLARENGVIILTLPPHTSHRTQPLDVGVFRSFSRFYNQGMREYTLQNPGKRISIKDIASFVGYAYPLSMTPQNIQNSFKKCGIYPYNRNVFTDIDFAPSQVTDRPDPAAAPPHAQTTANDQSNVDQPSVSGQSQEEPAIPRSLPDNPQPSTSRAHNPQPSTSRSDGPQPSTGQANALCPSTTPQAKSPSDSLAGTSKAVSPYDVRPLQKAARVLPNQSKVTYQRKKGKSMIATSSPNFKQLLQEREEKSKPKKKSSGATKGKSKAKQTKKAKTTLFHAANDSSSSDEQMEETEFRKLLDTDSDDEYEEGDNDDEVRIVDVEAVRDALNIEEGAYFVIEFEAGTLKVYYTGKVMEVVEGGVTVNCLRRQEKTNRFTFLNQPDISEVNQERLKYRLPAPTSTGQTKRQRSMCIFDVIIPENLDLR